VKTTSIYLSCIKSKHTLVFNNYFYKNKKLKLYFEDRVVVLNDLFYGCEGSILSQNKLCVNTRNHINIL
jgi:hypothetical protein